MFCFMPVSPPNASSGKTHNLNDEACRRRRAGSPDRTDLETDRAYRLLSELDPQQLRKLIPLAQDKQFDDRPDYLSVGRNVFISAPDRLR